MKTVCALLALVTYCAAQTPTPCESPKQWEGRLYRSDRTHNTNVLAKISYDEVNQRVRIIEEVQEGSTQSFYDVLFIHSVNKEYRLDLKTRKCNVTNLDRPFRPMGVPPFARFLFEATIGAAGFPGESLIAQTWDGEFEDKSRFIVSTTYPDCVPLNSGYFSNSTGFIQDNFFDITVGISDPSVFIPPTECGM